MRFHLMLLTSAAVLAAPYEAQAVRVGPPCGGITGLACSAGHWCEPLPGLCNVSDVEGICVRIEHICSRQRRPVCACIGLTYANDCLRRSAGVAKRHNGACR